MVSSAYILYLSLYLYSKIAVQKAINFVRNRWKFWNAIDLVRQLHHHSTTCTITSAVFINISFFSRFILLS